MVWRTNTPGGCTRTPVQQWPQNSTRHPAGVDKLFNHAEFLEWDNAAVRVFADAKIPVVDLRMLYLRSDAHVAVNPWNKAPDCLHYCLRNSALHRTFPRMVQHVIGDHRSFGGGYLKGDHQVDSPGIQGSSTATKAWYLAFNGSNHLYFNHIPKV